MCNANRKITSLFLVISKRRWLPCRVVIAVGIVFLGLNFQFANDCRAADAPVYRQPVYPVQQAGLNAGSADPNVNNVMRATHTQADSPHVSQPIEKSPPLTPPHASLSGEKSSSAPRTMGAIVSVVLSLAVVLALFWGCAWLMRRGMPNTAKRLPSDAVEVLGRAPLTGRQQMHVVRFGNKMLLICISPSGVDTLGEITDPAEIDRLAGLCEQSQPQSASTAFKQIFGQLAGEGSAKSIFIGKKSSLKEVADV